MPIRHAAAAGAGSGAGGLLDGSDWDAAHEYEGFAPGGFTVGGIFSGVFVDSSRSAGSGTGRTMSANNFVLVPYVPPVSFNAVGLGIRAGTSASGDAKVCAYTSGDDGWPDALLFESSAFTLGSTNTTYYSTCDLDLVGGQLYWLGARVSSNPSLWSNGNAYAAGICNTSSLGDLSSSTCKTIEHSLTFATAAPNPFPMDPSMLWFARNPILFGIEPA